MLEPSPFRPHPRHGIDPGARFGATVVVLEALRLDYDDQFVIATPTR